MAARLSLARRAVPSWYERLLRQFFGPESTNLYTPSICSRGGGSKWLRKNFRMVFWPKYRPYRRPNFSGWKTPRFLIPIGTTSPTFGICESFILETAISQTTALSIFLSFRNRHLEHERHYGNHDSAIPCISKLPKLTNLKLGSIKITDQGLRTLSPSSQLEILELENLKITSDGVELLKNIPSLKDVSLDWTHVDDRALDFLAIFPTLKSSA